jgi:predicted PurR-regulated permease PerM
MAAQAEKTPETTPLSGRSTARRALITTLVAVAVVIGALALWKLRVVVALLFIALIIAAAMRPGIEWMAQRRIPRSVGVLLHYLVVLALVATFLSFVVPHLVTQVQQALDTVNTHGSHGAGFKGKLLDAIQRRLNHLPSASRLIHPALTIGETALKVLVGVLFTFATAAYWIFERDRTVDLVTSFFERPKRRKIRDTWELIDLRLGAFVRGELLLITIAALLISSSFWIVGEPYWLLLGIAIAILEIVPVVGPLIGVVLAAAAGLTLSWHTAAFAVGALLLIRVLQDYVLNPRVMGGVVGLSPLIVLVSVSTVGILFGGFYVLLSVPIASVVATIVDVAVRGVEPAEENAPKLLFSADGDGDG